MGEAQLKFLLIFQLPVEESDTDSLTSYVHQSSMTASDGIKELDGFSFGIKAPEGLQPKGFENILHPIPELMGMGCCMLDEKHLDCFVKAHPPDSCKRWLTDEIIKFYIIWTLVFRRVFLFALSTNQSSCHVHLFHIYISNESLSKRLQ